VTELDDRAEAVRDLPDASIECRAGRHMWTRPVERYSDKAGKPVSVIESSLCVPEWGGCGATRTQEFAVPSFEPVTRPIIKYPEGYLVKGVGRVGRYEAKAERYRRRQEQAKRRGRKR
jgi:hypothetical protein